MSRRPKLSYRIKLALIMFALTVLYVVSLTSLAQDRVTVPTSLSALASPITATDLVQQGRSLYEAGRYPEAIDVLQAAL
ncbi:hypothetical protein ACN4EK_18990 [Pantanalinema rosaneae CENA516]|uniref:hypothetical protein n=1 Tax=Pantanalinema rosaneae TaxID=1620701 RepID=UPI003D6E1562